MKIRKELSALPVVALHFIFQLLLYLNSVESSLPYPVLGVEEEEPIPRVSWIQTSLRTKRSDEQSIFSAVSFDCLNKLKRICGLTKDSDELLFLECIQTFKPIEVSSIDNQCQHLIWKYVGDIGSDENIRRLTKKACGNDLLDSLACGDSIQGSLLTCLIEKRDSVMDTHCKEYIQRLEWFTFSDVKIISPFVSMCKNDIDRFQCGRIQPYKDLSQGQMLACLQQYIDKLELTCRKQILHVSEIQSDNVKLDRQLHLACLQDHMKFCPDVRPGSGQVYKCLIQHKMDRSMTPECQDQLLRREKLIAFDYKVSKGLVRACKEDIKTHHCRKSVSDDKDIRLAQILLCLESAIKNGSKVSRDCQGEMFDHRKILMEDYRLSPEIVNGCASDIKTFCNNLEVGGITIHCLMDHTWSRKRKRVSLTCQRALEDLMKETDAAEDWRIDPVLREACKPVVDFACKNVRGGDARIISCLMDRLGDSSAYMTEACDKALVQIEYFVSRNYKLDPQLYRACKPDAIHFCHAGDAWASDGLQMDPERGPLILPCLYRYAYHPQKNMTLKKECSDEIRRVMRQRAINVDLQPEIEEVCLHDLALLCFEKTAKGEEILCLQDNLESLSNPQCKLAVGNLTEEQAEKVDLNPIVRSACQHIMGKHCEEVLKYGKDEGDMMECLIEHKNELDARSDYKCKAAIEHFQLISIKNYHFTFKFKEACRPHVMRWCPQAKTKAQVITCLSDVVQDDVMKDSQNRISKDCRQQLKSQLYQQRENIKFDPSLFKACTIEIKQYCFNIEPGNSQVLECLARNKAGLGDECHAQLFRNRKQVFQDSSIDFALLNTCHSMVKQFCHDIDRSKTLDCLKRYKDYPMFNEKCKNFVIKRMIEQNTDYRFNMALQKSCTVDIHKHCKEVLVNEPKNKELEGKVIKCLKIKFRESKLTVSCERQMASILREAALNYHLNPLLMTMCAHEIDSICQPDETLDGNHEIAPGKVEECLKDQFNADNKDMREECRMQVADLIEEARADINVDPLLQKACAVDVSKYCSSVPQGAGRHIMCLQNVLKDQTKSLQPDCYKMLNERMEMFRIASKIVGPNTVQELYDTVYHSPAKRYFLILTFTAIGIIFIIGLSCGRVSRRTMMMKNK